jgi:hypothetical protein
VKAWDAKLLAYVLLRRNTVAGLPGEHSLFRRVVRTASAKHCKFLLEEYTMLNYPMTAPVLVTLAFAFIPFVSTTDDVTHTAQKVGDGLHDARYGLCIAS